MNIEHPFNFDSGAIGEGTIILIILYFANKFFPTKEFNETSFDIFGGDTDLLNIYNFTLNGTDEFELTDNPLIGNEDYNEVKTLRSLLSKELK